MTVRVVTVSGSAGAGAAVGRYYDQVMQRQIDVVADVDLDGPESGPGGRVAAYYASASGAFWMGAGAARLGLDGVPAGRQIAALVEGHDGDGVRLGRKFGDTSARAFDVTFSVQKEVSILWAAADGPTRAVIEQAVVDAATAVLDDQVGARAATRMRTGPDGGFLAADRKPVMVSAEGPAVAVIPEFTSRKGDPQLHVHGLVSSKVWEPTTERWLALDARELKQDQRALSGLFHAGLESELSAKLGVTWGSRAYTYARTIDGISEGLIDVFSQRRADVDARLAEKVERFEASLGHAPTPQQRWRLEREAAVDSRPTKSAEVLDFDGWHTAIAQHAGLDPTELVASVTGRPDRVATITQAQLDDMVTAALGELADTKSSWTRGDFKAELARVLPPDIAVTPTQLVAFVNTQTDAALDAMVPVSSPTVDRPNLRWTTPDVLTQETRILEHIETATIDVVPANGNVGEHADVRLDDLQIAAAGRVASNSDFEIVVGLAGAGKTSMLKAAVDVIETEQRDVFGLAPSASAAQVLAEETGIAADNVSKFLWEHQQRDGGPSEAFRLGPGATLIIDEAGMVSTPQWDDLLTLASVNGWRVRAVGDGYQFAAVGRGGIFDHLASTLPDHRVSRLEQVHRFDNPWEGQASAALRQGNHDVLDLYETHGRIIPTGPDTSLVDTVTNLYMQRHRDGIEVGVFAATNTQVDELNTTIQTALNNTGRLGPRTGATGAAGEGLFVGDLIETRHNNRNLVTDRNLFVKNRDRWTITGHGEHGDLTVTGSSGTVTLPADYVGEYVNLAYAQTAHGSQGRTISGTSIYAYNPDTAPTDRAGIYVPMTRGRHENVAVIQADSPTIAKQHLVDAISRRWIDTPAISHLHEQQDHVEPVPIAEQLDAAHQVLDTYEQQTLFTPAPTPTVQPEVPTRPPVEPASPTLHETLQKTPGARRSEAEPRQHHPTQHREPSIADTAPPLSPEVAEEVAVLQPELILSSHDLVTNLGIVDRLAYGVDNAPDHLEAIDAARTETLDRYRQTAATHNELIETRNTHADNKPLLRGVKEWQATLNRYDHALAGSSQDLERIKTSYEDLGTQRDNWSQYRSLAVQLELGTARTALEADREQRGLHATTNPDPAVLARIGPLPTEPEARHAWTAAAGAISQRSVFKDNYHDRADIDHYSIDYTLKANTKTAVTNLGQHVGIEQIPELQPQPITRDLGRGLSL